MKILGIETSCDETAAAVVEDGQNLLSNVVQSQIDIHAEYGGVVPEIAARSHVEAINPVIQKALDDAALDWQDIDAVAVTFAPGLSGSLLVGTLAAKTLAFLKNKPLYKIHHIKAHVFAAFISRQAKNLNLKLPEKTPEFPLLALIVSGGHTQLMLFNSAADFEILGQTTDDAVGEAFDKVAKILGLPYPGGPSIAKAAENGDSEKYSFPIAKLKNKYDFSFSGLKPAVLRQVQKEVGVGFDFPSYKLAELLSQQQKADFAASFQNVAARTLVEKTALACQEFQPRSLVLAGGVAANLELRRQIESALWGEDFSDLDENNNRCDNSNTLEVFYPPIQLCTDNAAMVAALAFFEAKHTSPASPFELEIETRLTLKKEVA